MSSSRRERRAFAKKLGLLGRKESVNQMMERFNRSKDAGDFIHTKHLQDIKNSQIQSEPELTESESNSQEEEIDPFQFLRRG